MFLVHGKEWERYVTVSKLLEQYKTACVERLHVPCPLSAPNSFRVLKCRYRILLVQKFKPYSSTRIYLYRLKVKRVLVRQSVR
jgi:hypothetical protein